MKSLDKLNILDLSKLYKELKIKYRNKVNIQKYLESRKFDSDTSINVSYDIQSGSYINFFNNLSKKRKNSIYFPIIEEYNKNFKKCKTLLDFGCGELTSSSFIIKKLSKKINKYFATDISLNRLFLGKNYIKKKLTNKDYKKLTIFCNTSSKLPFRNNSIDLVLTVHALEPNNKNKNLILNELLRVSKYGLLLMEPYFEKSNKKQQRRMKKYNYIRGLKKTLVAKGCYVEVIKKDHHINSLNESSIFIVKKIKKTKVCNDCNFVDPINQRELNTIDGFLYSKENFRLYPKFGEIYIFNELSRFYLPKI